MKYLTNDDTLGLHCPGQTAVQSEAVDGVSIFYIMSMVRTYLKEVNLKTFKVKASNFTNRMYYSYFMYDTDDVKVVT